ncbi:hypothetical protein ACIA8O_38080 [Kitasatospora sp. NPDC051853]|uniref:hypothetical protein n=1 Tax=Kitasatospora sp. NPDC051853 TaxID=3364058 RepID=UPI0037B4380E
MTPTTLLVDGAVAFATGFAVRAVPRVLRGRERTSTGRTVSPAAALAVVVALVYLNQLLCAAYLLRVHGGDPSYVTRYLPEGWFAQPVGNPVVEWLAERLPVPGLFAVTVLRVQAFLELPLVLFAYGTVLRLLGPAPYRRLLGSRPLVWAAALSYTVVFGVVEWDLHNPWTGQDLAVRAASALVTPLVVTALARRETGGERRLGAGGLLGLTLGLWALGQLVMVVYDTALLYNLGHLGGRWPSLLLATAGVFGASWAVDRWPGAGGGETAAALEGVLRWSLAYFLVPALAVRYSVAFGTPLLGALAGLLVGALALRQGLGGRAGAALPWLLAGGAAGLVAAYLAVRAVTDTYYESALLRAMAVLLGTTALTCGFADRRRAQRAGGAASR